MIYFVSITNFSNSGLYVIKIIWLQVFTETTLRVPAYIYCFRKKALYSKRGYQNTSSDEKTKKSYTPWWDKIFSDQDGAGRELGGCWEGARTEEMRSEPFVLYWPYYLINQDGCWCTYDFWSAESESENKNDLSFLVFFGEFFKNISFWRFSGIANQTDKYFIFFLTVVFFYILFTIVMIYNYFYSSKSEYEIKNILPILH